MKILGYNIRPSSYSSGDDGELKAKRTSIKKKGHNNDLIIKEKKAMKVMMMKQPRVIDRQSTDDTEDTFVTAESISEASTTYDDEQRDAIIDNDIYTFKQRNDIDNNCIYTFRISNVDRREGAEDHIESKIILSSTSEEEAADRIDLALNKIKTMKEHEDANTPCSNYLQLNSNSKDIDESCRKALVTWCQTMQRVLKLSTETTYIAVSLFDRYLSSSPGRNTQGALSNKYKFQLACISSFYLATKLYDEIELNAVTMARLSKGYYEPVDILTMEAEIMSALNFPRTNDFRLVMPTPMNFIHQYLKLLPGNIIKTECLIVSCQKRVEYTITEMYFALLKPSVVAAACLCSSLAGKGSKLSRWDLISAEERKTFYFQLAKSVDLISVMEAENMLLMGHTKPMTVSKLTNTYYEPKAAPTPNKVKVECIVDDEEEDDDDDGSSFVSADISHTPENQIEERDDTKARGEVKEQKRIEPSQLLY